MEMMHYDVIIATPGSMLCCNYVQSLAETLSALAERGLTYKYVNCQGSPVNVARERVMAEVEKYSYNKVIWIDSDIGFTPEDIFKLYDSDKDIITGTYLLADGILTTIGPLPQDRKPGQGEFKKQEVLKLNKVMKVHSAGFGIIAMTSKVFPRIPKPYFQLLNNVIKNGSGKDIYISLGEDISWCLKAQDVGFDIWFDPTILVNHMKTNTVGWK
jgi:hypothetical protein